ncbi:hypothetical protein [Gimesia algae]|uniref:Chromosome partition protein Smc n=1 Tax=Gimesia algae TaxID=2527971 RepID=A0A517VIN5_9PLAN|nr:hypothetical protein [Gimesia algae]QDT92874.1 hypothetical protein Pan161_45450 [Gimesia algae]
MKSTLATILVILVLASLLNSETPFSFDTKVEAQPPVPVAEQTLSRAIDRYLETEARHEKRRAHTRRPDHERESARHPELDDRPGNPHPQARREHERHMDQQRHRIQKIQVAAEHLQDAGLPELAHQVRREAEEQEQRLQQHLEHMHHPEHGLRHEVRESLQQLRNEVHELKREVHQLKSILTERVPQAAE